MTGIGSQRNELDELRAEVTRLREEVKAITAQRRPEPPSDAQRAEKGESAVVGRRSLLSRAALVAAGGAGLALAGKSPAAAATGDPLIVGQENSANLRTRLKSRDTAFEAISEASGSGVCALAGRNNASGIGVVAASVTGKAVHAFTSDGNALVAEQYGNSTHTSKAAVIARTPGTGAALYAENKYTGPNIHGTASGVYGVARGPGASVIGVKARGVPGAGVAGQADTGPGIEGTSQTGRGGSFGSTEGAQVRLVPSTAATHPASGLAGDLFLDASKRLWLCKRGTTWVQVA